MKGKNRILLQKLQTAAVTGLLLSAMMGTGVSASLTEIDGNTGNVTDAENPSATDISPATETPDGLMESQPTTQGVAAGFSDVTQEQDLESQNREEQLEEDSGDMPEWTERLVTGRGESEAGFSGPKVDMSKIDPDYEGELDPVSGQPVTVSNGQTVTTAGRVQLSDNMEYDVDTGLFVYTSVRYATEVQSNVANEMITRDAVVIQVPEGVNSILYQDGNALENPDYRAITEPGNYAFRLGNGSETDDLFTFTIVSGITGAISYYDLPEGFQITSVIRDGEDVTDARTRATLLEEGEYQIVYDCPKANLSYSLMVTIDHTAPELVFEGVDERGRARNPVIISGLKEGESVAVTRDGKEVNIRNNTLRSSGEYELVATDQAGNVSTYEVTILLYLNAQSVIFFALFLAVIVAVIVYLEYQRRKLRVR